MKGFLFGKLPAFGDFVIRGLSVPMRSWWDSRCSAEVLTAQAGCGDDFVQRYLETAPRRFLIDPPIEGDPWQAGCLVPSLDLAGRAFPFVLGIGSPVPFDAAVGAALGERIAECLGRAFEENVDLDALIAAVEIAARDTAGAARPVLPITACQPGRTGKSPHSVEI